MTILGGLWDRKVKNGWRGEVLAFHGRKCTRLAFVYGMTLDEMHKSKRCLTSALRTLYQEKS